MRSTDAAGAGSISTLLAAPTATKRCAPSIDTARHGADLPPHAANAVASMKPR
jgi:hypothetical protein